jgi:cyclopropane fatty-acyl-phospholipid synthase-like methyltransferase
MSLQRNVQWFKMMLRSDSDAATNYNLRGAAELLTTANQVPTINLGYWNGISTSAPDGLWQATQALFQLVGETAELSPRDRAVLDVGCGYGTCAAYLLEEFGPKEVVGLNVSSLQLEYCRRLASRPELGGRVSFQQGSATQMPFPDARFDKVVSVEAAFHFQTRAAFLREAARTLRPGGRLALIDLVVVPPRNPLERLNLALLRRSIQIPAPNVQSLPDYVAELEAAGFVVEQARSIREYVIARHREWVLKNQLRKLANLDLALLLTTATFYSYPWDYVVIKARKPE